MTCHTDMVAKTTLTKLETLMAASMRDSRSMAQRLAMENKSMHQYLEKLNELMRVNFSTAICMAKAKKFTQVEQHTKDSLTTAKCMGKDGMTGLMVITTSASGSIKQ